MEDNDITEYLNNAKQVEFLTADQNKGLPTIFIIFEDIVMARSIYPEFVYINKTNKLYIHFSTFENQLVISFMLQKDNTRIARMVVDYDKGELAEFIENVEDNSKYLVVFGKYDLDGSKIISEPFFSHEPPQDFLSLYKYAL